jgi:hypothetical protein
MTKYSTVIYTLESNQKKGRKLHNTVSRMVDLHDVWL